MPEIVWFEVFKEPKFTFTCFKWHEDKKFFILCVEADDISEIHRFLVMDLEGHEEQVIWFES